MLLLNCGARVTRNHNVEDSLGTTLVGQDTTTSSGNRRINSKYDPLAESFFVEDDPHGVFYN